MPLPSKRLIGQVAAGSSSSTSGTDRRLTPKPIANISPVGPRTGGFKQDAGQLAARESTSFGHFSENSSVRPVASTSASAQPRGGDGDRCAAAGGGH